MSISLKVVSIAAVFCAAFRRSAIRLLRRLMRTRLAPLGTPSRNAGEGGPSPRGWVGEGIRRSVGDPAEHRPDGYIGAFLGEDFDERAGSRRRDLEGDLIGFELGDGLVGSDRL